MIWKERAIIIQEVRSASNLNTTELEKEERVRMQKGKYTSEGGTVICSYWLNHDEMVRPVALCVGSTPANNNGPCGTLCSTPIKYSIILITIAR